MTLAPDLQIADALNCNADKLVFDEHSYFYLSESCTVELGALMMDCYFKNGKINLILNARTGDKIWSA
jgi:hypothetical protein